MSLDLTQFHATFFEESFEALSSMEAALLQLSSGDADAELINTIFRVAHSIKGGSATFGFSDVAAFTHTAETLLDQVRSGQRPVDAAIIDVLLRSSDVMRDMLTATQQKQPGNKEQAAAVHAELQALMKAPTTGNSGSAAVTAASKTPTATAIVATASTDATAPVTQGYRVQFVPGTEMLRHGNDAVRMLRELTELGSATVRVNAGKVPPLSDLDPEVCNLSWTVEIAGDFPASAITQIFEWAEGECEVSVTPLDSGIKAPAAAAPTLTPDPTSSAAATASPAAAPSPATPAGATAVASTSTPGTAPGTPAAATNAQRAAASEGSSIRVSIEKIDELLNSVGELVITQSVLSQLAAPLQGRDADALRAALMQLERHMRELQESVMRVRMLPISFVFNRFPRMIRDLGQRLNKKLELRMSGEHTELDKTVMEKIGDPLVHLVRNSIDHGIETPEKRLAAGKPEVGTIHLHAYHKGGNVIVEVSDDGGGLNSDKILAKARERGLVGADEQLTEERIYNLIFAPGFSTADVVSDVSGRGVGMDVVRRNINELGGHVQILSTPGKGSTVRIRLPLTLAIMDGQLVRVGTEVYVVPIVSILETIQVKREQVATMVNTAEVFRLRDEYLPIVRLYKLFGIQPEHTDLLDGLLMIVEADGKRIGLFVDELMSQQQVVIKSLETNFRQIGGLAGATMLGDGRVAMILDVPGLMASYQDSGTSGTDNDLRAA